MINLNIILFSSVDEADDYVVNHYIRLDLSLQNDKAEVVLSGHLVI